MESHTEKEYTPGPIVKCMMASGHLVLRRVKVSGKVFLETLTLANGVNLRLQATECTSGKTEIDMRASGKTVLSTDRVLISLPTAIVTLVLTAWVNLTDKASISGKIQAFTSASLKMG
jgi:hypothetical protein